MKINEIIKTVTEREGKKTPVSIAQVSEIVGILSDMAAADAGVVATLITHGRKRKAK